MSYDYTNLGKLFTPQEDEYIIHLKEVEGLTWLEIGKKFAVKFDDYTRSRGSIQVHYSRKLQRRAGGPRESTAPQKGVGRGKGKPALPTKVEGDEKSSAAPTSTVPLSGQRPILPRASKRVLPSDESDNGEKPTLKKPRTGNPASSKRPQSIPPRAAKRALPSGETDGDTLPTPKKLRLINTAPADVTQLKKALKAPLRTLKPRLKAAGAPNGSEPRHRLPSNIDDWNPTLSEAHQSRPTMLAGLLKETADDDNSTSIPTPGRTAERQPSLAPQAGAHPQAGKGADAETAAPAPEATNAVSFADEEAPVKFRTSLPRQRVTTARRAPSPIPLGPAPAPAPAPRRPSTRSTQHANAPQPARTTRRPGPPPPRTRQPPRPRRTTWTRVPALRPGPGVPAVMADPPVGAVLERSRGNGSVRIRLNPHGIRAGPGREGGRPHVPPAEVLGAGGLGAGAGAGAGAAGGAGEAGKKR